MVVEERALAHPSDSSIKEKLENRPLVGSGPLKTVR
jgi:hypothetical protein